MYVEAFSEGKLNKNEKPDDNEKGDYSPATFKKGYVM